MSKRKNSSKAVSQKELNDFEELFRLYYPRMKKYTLSLLHDDSEADDVVQEVFYQLWLNRAKLDYHNHISSYVFTILKNKCLNYLKHKIVEDKYFLQASINKTEELYHISFQAFEEFISMEEMLMVELNSIMDDMSDKCRTVFRLKWFEGKKNREIADFMGISTTMVDKYIANGLEIARRGLNPDIFIFFTLKVSIKGW